LRRAVGVAITDDSTLVASADGSADGSITEDVVDVGKLTLGIESVVIGEASSVVVGKNWVGSGTSVINGSEVLVGVATVSSAA